MPHEIIAESIAFSTPLVLAIEAATYPGEHHANTKSVYPIGVLILDTGTEKASIAIHTTRKYDALIIILLAFTEDAPNAELRGSGRQRIKCEACAD